MQETYPMAEIGNGRVKLALYLPDAERGFYRGTRFEGSGLVARAECGGHSFFGPFRLPHVPSFHDCVVGPAEEFGMAAPLGFAETAPGEPFLKIGVGLLEKTEDPRYGFSREYRILQALPWEVRQGADWIEFAQEAGGEWGYRYAKRIALANDGFVITHRLGNTGARPWETDHYCHNFVLIDDDPVGPQYRLRFPFEAREPQRVKELAEVRGRELSFLRTLEPGDTVWMLLHPGAGSSTADNAVEIENTRTGAGLRIEGDRPLLKYAFYAERTAVCPEPFLSLALAPAEETAWRTTYTFLTA